MLQRVAVILSCLARIIACAMLMLVGALVAAGCPDSPPREETTSQRLNPAVSVVSIAFGITLSGNLLIAVSSNSQPRRMCSGIGLSGLGLIFFYAADRLFSGSWPSGWVLPTLGVPSLLQFTAILVSKFGPCPARGDSDAA
ncbi:MAG: hypothetical protein Fues2KO_14150 [Fuerstiella sp.]